MPQDCEANKNDPCTDSESIQYQQLVGKLNWVANQTQPDMFWCLWTDIYHEKPNNSKYCSSQQSLENKRQLISYSFPQSWGTWPITVTML